MSNHYTSQSSYEAGQNGGALQGGMDIGAFDRGRENTISTLAGSLGRVEAAPSWGSTTTTRPVTPAAPLPSWYESIRTLLSIAFGLIGAWVLFTETGGDLAVAAFAGCAAFGVSSLAFWLLYHAIEFSWACVKLAVVLCVAVIAILAAMVMMGMLSFADTVTFVSALTANLFAWVR